MNLWRGIRSRLAWRRLGKTAFSFAALAAIALQAFAVQTHVHAFAPLAAAGYEAPANNGTAHEHASASHAPTACAFCLVLATAGNLALPDAPQICDAERGLAQSDQPYINAAPRAVTHTWRSRAPPIAL